MTQGGQYPAGYSFQPGENKLTLQFTSGATGAVPALSGITCKAGFGTPVRDGVGTYHVILSNPWARYLGGRGSVLQTGGTYDATKAFDVKVFKYTASTKRVDFVCVRPDTGVAAEMASGDVLTLRLTMAQEKIPGRR